MTALARLREPRAGPPTKIASHGFRKDYRDLIAWFTAKSRRTDGIRKGCRPPAPFGKFCEALLGLATGSRSRRANRAGIQAEGASGRTSASPSAGFARSGPASLDASAAGFRLSPLFEVLTRGSKIDRVEAFQKLGIDGTQKLAGLAGAALGMVQSPKTYRSAQFPR
jgi:hypothetical protein